MIAKKTILLVRSAREIVSITDDQILSLVLVVHLIIYRIQNMPSLQHSWLLEVLVFVKRKSVIEIVFLSIPTYIKM